MTEAEKEVLDICRARRRSGRGGGWCLRELSNGSVAVIDTEHSQTRPVIAQGTTWEEVLDQVKAIEASEKKGRGHMRGYGDVKVHLQTSRRNTWTGKPITEPEPFCGSGTLSVNGKPNVTDELADVTCQACIRKKRGRSMRSYGAASSHRSREGTSLEAYDGLKTYRLYTYDVWGNREDGYEVNNVFRTSDTVELDDDWSDEEILKAMKKEGFLHGSLSKWDIDSSSEDTFYFEYDGKPSGELRLDEDD